MSLDPAIAIPTVRPLCSHAPFRTVDGGYSYGPHPDLQGFWSIGLTGAATREMRDRLPARQGRHPFRPAGSSGQACLGRHARGLVLDHLGKAETDAPAWPPCRSPSCRSSSRAG